MRGAVGIGHWSLVIRHTSFVIRHSPIRPPCVGRRATAFAAFGVALLLAAAPGGARGADVELTLESAIARGLEWNRDLRRTAQALRKSELNVQGAESEFAVSVKPKGSGGVSQDGGSWGYGLAASKRFLAGTEVQASGGVTQDPLGDSSLRRTTLEVEARQPLFRNFGALVQGEQIVASQMAFLSARRRYELQKSALILSIVNAYESVIRLQRQIESDEQLFDRTDKLYRLTRARESQGRTTRVDTLRVELQRGQAQLRLQSSREELANTLRDLAEFLGYPAAATFHLSSPPLLKVDVPPVSVAVSTALSNRLEYAQALQDYRDTQRGFRIAHRRIYPDVSLVTRYSRYGDNTGSSADNDQWFAGLALDTDLNRTQDRLAIEGARIDRATALEDVRIREIDVAREVEQAIAVYRRTQAEIDIAERNATLADGRAELARRMFKLGKGDNFSVTDAEEAHSSALNQFLNAREDASVSAYRLLQALGTLLEAPAELKPVSLEEQP